VRRLFLLVSLLFLAIGSVFCITNPFSYPVKTVIVDAGHGGKDPGTSYAWSFAGGTIYEKEYTLDIALRVKALLEVAHSDWNIILTRNSDSYISLADRCAIAYGIPLEKKSSAVFVSIHVNSAPNNQAEGYEILTKMQGHRVTLLDELTPRTNISLLAGFGENELNEMLNERNSIIASTFGKVLQEKMPLMHNRGVKEQNIQVLNASRVPAVLVEVCFITNEVDAKNLITATWRQSMANAIATAIETL